MNSANDEKPRVILEEYKTSKNLPTAPTVLNEVFSVKNFKKKFRIVVVRNENYEMEFDMIGIHPFLANTFRRLMLSDVPSMAIEKVYIHNNTSIIQDEVLAHRLGLIPLKADARLFEYKEDSSAASNENDSLEYELKIKCSYNKEANKKDSSREEDMYKNNNVYSKHIKWVPVGNQKERFKEADVGPIETDILIAKMRPGHELDLKLVAVKGVGRDHAKFSPVATAFYRLMPDIKLVREVTGDAAYKLQSCFSPGVIGIRNKKDGRKIAVVNNARYDTGSRNVFRYDDLKDAVVMTKIQDHFIFTIESVGAMQPDVIFREAVNTLKEKCSLLLEELNSS
ncbi:DNA-directed RNA polymerases I and III subunit RPAC1 [Diabrotica virgifera virgifera]|uniref:DNA-directed RNA polymerases I and III subunit RPAC1 n=1 Tax=Diabrotica virgifera virgifera TaxID=50390 RepID=A0A6P7FCK4_DIAVI|nr:DNA-directed RNA polymerases I and III subunit RPAC1 [Diabrotica virgifera virgifera]